MNSRCEHLLIIYPVDLWKSLSHKPGFESCDSSFLIILNLENPLAPNRSSILWQWFNDPYSVWSQVQQFFLNGFPPLSSIDWVSHCFFIWMWFHSPHLAIHSLVSPVLILDSLLFSCSLCICALQMYLIDINYQSTCIVWSLPPAVHSHTGLHEGG